MSMKINMDWVQEEWATDLFKELAVSIFAPTPKETIPTSPQLGGQISFGDWVIPVTIIAVVAVIVIILLKR